MILLLCLTFLPKLAFSHGDGFHDHVVDDSWRNQIQDSGQGDERPPNLVPLYKLYSEQLKDHMFTANAHVAFRSIPAYTYEGIAGYISPISTPQSPHELASFFAGHPRNDSFLTADAHEAYRMKADTDNPYLFTGIVGYCSLHPQPGQCPLYRLFRSTPGGGIVDHFYTTREHDNHILEDAGSTLEGVTCYIYCTAT